MESEKIIIKITNKESSLELVLPDDMDIMEWGNQFKTILLWLTFHPETIKELFYDEEEVCDKTLEDAAKDI